MQNCQKQTVPLTTFPLSEICATAVPLGGGTGRALTTFSLPLSLARSVQRFHLLAVFGQRPQADLGAALVHVGLVLDRLRLHLAVHLLELRTVELLLALADQDAVGQ